jgi:hypothetical protein
LSALSVSSLAVSCSTLSNPAVSQSWLSMPVTSQSVATQTLELPTDTAQVSTQTSELPKPPTLPLRTGAYRAPVTLKTRKLTSRQFAETPKRTIAILVEGLVSRCNVRGKGCCALHIGLQALLKRVMQMAADDCQPGFRLVGGWQCKRCFVLGEDGADEQDRVLHECAVCFTPRIDQDAAASREEEASSEEAFRRQLQLSEEEASSGSGAADQSASDEPFDESFVSPLIRYCVDVFNNLPLPPESRENK